MSVFSNFPIFRKSRLHFKPTATIESTRECSSLRSSLDCCGSSRTQQLFQELVADQDVPKFFEKSSVLFVGLFVSYHFLSRLRTNQCVLFIKFFVCYFTFVIQGETVNLYRWVEVSENFIDDNWSQIILNQHQTYVINYLVSALTARLQLLLFSNKFLYDINIGLISNYL